MLKVTNSDPKLTVSHWESILIHCLKRLLWKFLMKSKTTLFHLDCGSAINDSYFVFQWIGVKGQQQQRNYLEEKNTIIWSLE